MGATNRLRALVVDDMQVNRLILGKLLQSFGFDVFYSKDGQEAYEFYKEQGTDISCVWMDINMPGMDGLEASRHIRSIEAAQLSSGKMISNGSEDSLSSSYPEEQVVPDTVARSTRSSSTAPIRRVPIVGVSACSLTEQLKSSALDGIPITEDTDKPWELCGMDLFVEKPINRSKLECVLDQLQDQLGMQSSDCSSSEPLETPASPQEPDWASCCGPLPVTDFMVSSCKDDGQVLKRTLEATALAETPLGSPSKKRKLAEALS